MSDLQTVSAEELAILEPLGERRTVEVDDVLYRAGDPIYDFYVVISGQVEITVEGGDVVATHGPGRFLGELNMLTGSRVFVTARVSERGEVLAVPATSLRLVLATEPELSDKILATFMERRATLRAGAASAATRVIASRYSPESLQIREFLARCQLPYEWLDPDADSEVDELLQQFEVSPSELPVVISSGVVLRQPTPASIAGYLGLTVGNLPERQFDLVIVGGGPAGLAAAVYGASEGLSTLGFDMVAPGGQAGTSSRIENYFGFPTGISGGDLVQHGMIQAEKFGAQLRAPCAGVSLREDAGHLIVELSDGTTVTGRAVIAATGARYRRLEVERLEEFEGRGVYYAATDLEARICAGNAAVVVGGGNSAGQAAVFLADQGSSVTVLIRGGDLGADMSRYLVDRLERHPRITVKTETVVTGLDGEESLAAVRIRGPEGERRIVCAALFSFIGADAGAAWLSSCAALDEDGFVLTDRDLLPEHLGDRWSAIGRTPLPFETSRPGLFAVGDVRSGSMKRVAAAVGEGSSAVRSVHQFLAFSKRSAPAVPSTASATIRKGGTR